MTQITVSPDIVPGVSGSGDQVVRNGFNNSNSNFNDLYTNKIFASFAATPNVGNLANAILLSDPTISCNVTVVGNYAFEGVMYISAQGANSNGVCGFQMAMNANTAVVNAISWHSFGVGNASVAYALSNQANNAYNNVAFLANVSVLNATPSYLEYKGFVSLNTVGTFGPAWAANIAGQNAVNRLGNSWFKMTKVG